MAVLPSTDSASRLAIATALAPLDDAAAYHFLGSLGSPSLQHDIQICTVCDSKPTHPSDQALSIVRGVRSSSGMQSAVAVAMRIVDIDAALNETIRDLVPSRKIVHSFINLYATNSGLEIAKTNLCPKTGDFSQVGIFALKSYDPAAPISSNGIWSLCSSKIIRRSRSSSKSESNVNSTVFPPLAMSSNHRQAIHRPSDTVPYSVILRELTAAPAALQMKRLEAEVVSWRDRCATYEDAHAGLWQTTERSD